MWYIVKKNEGIYRSDYVGSLISNKFYATLSEAIRNKPKGPYRDSFLVVNIHNAPQGRHVWTKNVKDYETNYIAYPSRSSKEPLELVPIEF